MRIDVEALIREDRVREAWRAATKWNFYPALTTFPFGPFCSYPIQWIDGPGGTYWLILDSMPRVA